MVWAKLTRLQIEVYLGQIEQITKAAQRVVLTDKLHNVRSLFVNLALSKEAIWLPLPAPTTLFMDSSVAAQLFAQTSQGP